MEFVIKVSTLIKDCDDDDEHGQTSIMDFECLRLTSCSFSGVARPQADRSGCQICRSSVFGDTVEPIIQPYCLYILVLQNAFVFEHKKNKHERSLWLTFFHLCPSTTKSVVLQSE